MIGFKLGFGLVALLGSTLAEDVVCPRGFSTFYVTMNEGDSFTFQTKTDTNYWNNMDCLAYYTMGTCSSAAVDCAEFQTRANRRCTSGDIFDIYDFGNGNFDTFCRANGPSNYPVSDGGFYLNFMSDASRRGPGFKCTVACTSGSGPTSGPSTAGPTTAAPTTAGPTTAAPTTVAPTTAGPTSAPGSCKCGLAKRQQRIVGGVTTEVNEYPWQVALVSSGGSSPFCGGSLIADRWVLTAAHCMVVSAQNMQVLLGEHDVSTTSEANTVRMNVKRIVKNAQYNSGTLNWDFSLLELESAVDFDANPHIQPVCLPSSQSGDFAGLDAIVSGWGTLSSGGSQPNKLQEVTVKVLSNTDCVANTGYSSSDITAQMMCAGVNGGGKDSCQGDSGGPLVSASGGNGVTPGQNYDLVGVVSWGYGCADASYPGVYARVTTVLDWINSNTSGSFNTCPRT